jgi:hypothetical protein
MSVGNTPNPDYVLSENFATLQDNEVSHLGIGKGTKLYGLALSGGGIRSASFALGVLQALYGFGTFEKFHYLSTVSGGGYIGSALTYFRNTFTQFGPNWFPFGYLKGASNMRAIGARTAKPTNPADRRAYEIVAFLRQHASFLTPSRQLDKPAMAAGVLRGLFASVLPYMTILIGALAFLLAVRFFDWRLGFGGIQTGSALAASASKEVPSPYLAAFPAGLAIGLLLACLLVGLWQVLGSSWASKGREDEQKAFARYKIGLESMSFLGMCLIWFCVLFLAAIMPWLHDFLDSLASKGGNLPTSFGALFAALAGAAAQIEKLRAIVGGSQRPPSALKSIGMVIAGIAFVFGVVLLAYIIGVHLANLIMSCLAPLIENRPLDESILTVVLHAVAAAMAAIVALIGVTLACFINVNHASQHRLYRDRLMEIFCAEDKALTEGKWYPAENAQKSAGWLKNMTKVKQPLHLINTTLVTTDSDDRKYRGRGGDNFLLSPLYCGSDATGWIKIDQCMEALSIATAASVSGAALNAHTGPHGVGGLRNKAYAALLSFLGLNLGYWARNPKKFEFSNVKTDFRMPHLLRPGLANISGRNLDEIGNYVQLTDGGHFENLAIYELIRRKVRFLWVSDAGQDTKFSFEDLSNAIERVRVDFGVNIRFYDDDYDLTHLLPKSADATKPASKNFAEEYKLARRGYAIGTIEYADKSEGLIVYIKSTLTRYLPGDIYGYKARNDDFPHQTTLDQFFDEEQFEAYRELGYRLSAQLFRDIAKLKDLKVPLPPALDKVATELGL